MADRSQEAPVDPRRITRLIRLKEVQHRVGLGRSTIYRWMAEGRFPEPVRLGGHSVAWAQDDIDTWIANQLIAAAEPCLSRAESDRRPPRAAS
jgi:prophage regulatory protein